MEQQYVRVIDSGVVFPIEGETKHTYRVPINEYRVIDKSCCELVSITVNTMPEEKDLPSVEATSGARKISESDIEEAANAYLVDSVYPYYSETAAKNSFKAGAAWALQGVSRITIPPKEPLESTIGGEKDLLQQGSLSGEWAEKAKEGYTISEEQITELLNLGDHHPLMNPTFTKLQEWFPNAEVFQPKKFYKVGDRIKTQYNTFVISLIDSDQVALINTRTFEAWDGVETVNDPYCITEEEMKSLVGIHNFTLIEPSNPKK